MTFPARATGHVFVSYVREDAARVDQLQQMLQAAGVTVWRDTSALRPGQDWKAEIRAAIARGTAFIACFSEHTERRDSSVLFDELAVAVDQMRQRAPGKVWLIPVRFADCSLPDIDLGFGRTLHSMQWVDLFGDEQELAAARLIASVRDIWAAAHDRDHAVMSDGVPGPAPSGWAHRPPMTQAASSPARQAAEPADRPSVSQAMPLASARQPGEPPPRPAAAPGAGALPPGPYVTPGRSGRRRRQVVAVCLGIMAIAAGATALALVLPSSPPGSPSNPSGSPSNPPGSPSSRQGPPLSFAAGKGIPLPEAVNTLASDNAPWPITLAGSTVFVSLGTSVQVMNAATGNTIGVVRPRHALESSFTLQGSGTGDDGTPALLVNFQGQQIALAGYVVHLAGHGTTPARIAAEIDAITSSGRLLWEFLASLGSEPEIQGDPVVTFVGSAGNDVIATVGDSDGDGVSTIAVDIARRKLLWRNRPFTAQAVIGDAVLGTYDTSSQALSSGSLGVDDAAMDPLRVEALDPDSEKPIWKLPGSVAVADLAQAGTGTFLEEAGNASSSGSIRFWLRHLSTGKGKVVALGGSMLYGSLTWSCQYDGQSAVVCYTPLDAKEFVVNGSTGAVPWQLPSGNRLGIYVSAVYDGEVYGHTTQGPLVLDARTSKDANDSPGIEPVLVDPDFGIAKDQNNKLEIYPVTG